MRRWLLDLVPGAIAAFALRRLGSASEHTAPPMVVLARTDGSRESYGADDDGNLDLPAISGFLEGGEAQCTIWHDQSGLGHDAVAVAAAPLFDASPDSPGPLLRFRPPAELRSGVTLEGLPAFSIFALFRANREVAATSVARWQGEGDFVVFPYHTGEVLVGIHRLPSERILLGVVPGEFAVYGVVWKQGAAEGFVSYRNAAPLARQPARNLPVAVRSAPLFIGSYAGLGEHFTGDLVELVVWPRALAPEEVGVVCENMRQAWTARPQRAPSHAFELTRRADAIFRLDEVGLAELGLDRLSVEIGAILADPALARWPIAEQLRLVERIGEIYTGRWHASGRSLVPALERLFHRVLATPGVTLDAACLFYDLLYFLYWYAASDFEAMRGIADQVMRPFAVAIRDGRVDGLPAITRRPLGGEPLRLGYLSQFARLGNPIGRCGHALLSGLTRHFPGKYQLSLYAWSEHDDAATAALAEFGVRVRRFTADTMAERIADVAAAIVADGIDILITDMNAALPTVLFERRTTAVQIFFQYGLPFWPLKNIDAILCVDSADFISQTAGYDVEKCFTIGLGPWDLQALAPVLDANYIAAERARFGPEARLIGTYGRLAKITPEFMGIVGELVRRHPQVVVLLGGTGDGGWIHDFIRTHGLTGRIQLVETYVDGHLWGHLLEVFLNTFPHGGGVSCREVMAKGRPVVHKAWKGPAEEEEEVPMLVGDDPAEYVSIVSRLLEDRNFYEEACAATRAFVATRPGEADCISAFDEAISVTVRRVRQQRPRTPTMSGE